MMEKRKLNFCPFPNDSITQACLSVCIFFFGKIIKWRASMSGNEAQQISGNQTYDQLKPKNLNCNSTYVTHCQETCLATESWKKKKCSLGFFLYERNAISWYWLNNKVNYFNMGRSIQSDVFKQRSLDSLKPRVFCLLWTVSFARGVLSDQWSLLFKSSTKGQHWNYLDKRAPATLLSCWKS